ncbi:MAG TPA: flagellar motor protein [Candidatus Marinimicrobia bacterium]|nr:flagellar motor protein [Candidatus Neomarinimicrobiota bacterium]
MPQKPNRKGNSDDEPNQMIQPDEDGENDEIGQSNIKTDAWLATYGDMVTLLLCFFVLLFAMSSVSEQKYLQLTESLKSALGKQQVPEAGTREGLQFVDKDSEKQPEAVDELGGMIKKEVDNIVSEVEEFILYNKLAGKVKVEANELGAVITLSDIVIFPSGESIMTSAGFEIMEKLHKILEQFAYHIKIRGHTDNVPVGRSSPFRSNWELSANRACEIVHFLIQRGVEPTLLSAEGYAEYRPIDTNSTAEGRARNRRVEIVYERNAISHGLIQKHDGPIDIIRGGQY